jgi:hypothetical protein
MINVIFTSVKNCSQQATALILPTWQKDDKWLEHWNTQKDSFISKIDTRSTYVGTQAMVASASSIYKTRLQNNLRGWEFLKKLRMSASTLAQKDGSVQVGKLHKLTQSGIFIPISPQTSNAVLTPPPKKKKTLTKYIWFRTSTT